jgi:hypothetical protein
VTSWIYGTVDAPIEQYMPVVRIGYARLLGSSPDPPGLVAAQDRHLLRLPVC